MLRQFAGLWLVFFGSVAAWRDWHGQGGGSTVAIAVVAMVIGGAGLIVPALVRPIYTGWMIVAFRGGWTVSRIALGLVLFVMFTAVGGVFRAMGRDTLRLRRAK